MQDNSSNIDLTSFKPEGKYSSQRGQDFFSPDPTKTPSASESEGRTKWVPKESFEVVSKRGSNITVFDVAAYILDKYRGMTTMKLHKLLYYSQAWSLVWDEQPLFQNEIQAWANGPVVKDLFFFHRGSYSISEISIGNKDSLSEVQKETVNSVCDYYGAKPAQWLIELTHMETPWKEARAGLAISERGNKVITFDAMANYYGSL